jgi:hypothetical protein
VDSQRVSPEAPLRAGQELRVGAVAYKVEISEGRDLSATIAAIDPSATVMQPMSPVAPPAAPPTPVAKPFPPPPMPPRAAASAPVARSSSDPGPTPAKKGRSPVFWIGTGCCGCLTLLLLLGGLFFGGIWYASKGPADAARAQLADIKSGQLDAAYDTATLSGTLTSASGETEQVTYVFVKEQDAWKIAGIHFAGDLSVPPLDAE